MDDWSVFGATGSTATAGYGPWERMSPLLSRRRKPDGTWEVKLTPSFKAGKPAVGKAGDPYADQSSVGVAARQVLPRIKENLIAQIEAPSLARAATMPTLGPLLGPPAARALDRVLPEALRGRTPASLEEMRRGSQEDVERAKEELRQSMAVRGAPPLATAATEMGFGAEAMALDPLNLIGAGVGARAGRAGREAAEALAPRMAREAAPVGAMAHAGSDVSPEAISRVARRERYVRISPGGEVTPILNDVAAVDMPVNPGEVKAVVGADGIPRVEMGRPNAAQARALEALGAEPPPAAPRQIPEPLEGIADELTPRAEDDLLASLGVRRGTGPERLRGAQRVEGRPEMSTKGITNVAGMQPELQEAALENFDLIYAARGKPRPVSIYHDAQGLADETGLTLADLLDPPGGRTWNDREVALGRSLLGGLRNRIKDTADQVVAGTLDPAAARTTIAEDRFTIAKLMASLQGRGASEWGRGLRSLQEEVGAFNSLGLAQGPTEKLGLALSKRYADKLDDDVIRRISQLDADHPEDLMNFLRTMERPKFRDYAASYWYGSILSGPKTLLRNGIGNVVKLAVDTEMRAVTPLAHVLMPGLEGRRYMREVVPAHVGLLKGLPKGIQRFSFVIRNGYDPERLVRELTGRRIEKFMPIDAFLLTGDDRQLLGFIPGKAVRRTGAALNIGPRLLEATDAFFKSIAESSERYAWATRKAIEEGADDVGGRAAQLLTEQPDEMVEAAKLFAAKATYTDPMSWVGSAAAAVRRGPRGAAALADRLTAAGGLGNKMLAGAVRGPEVIGRHLMPFIHVSDRVAAGVSDFIPGSKPFKTASLLAEKSPEAADLIARQVVGGALGLMAIGWAGQGKLIGQLPKDPDLRNDAYAAGKQPFSALYRGKWIPLRDLLGPLAGPFVAAALYHDHVQAGEDPTTAVTGMTLSSARYMLDASYLQTLQDVVQAVEEDAPGDVGRGIVSAGARVAGGYAPWSGAQRGVATAMDPRVVEKEGFIDEIKAGLPGLRQTLPARIGPLGEELKISTGSAGGFSPVVPTENKIADPQLEERIGRLRYTLQRHRTELGRTERKVEDAQRGAAGEAGLAGKDQELNERAAALRGTLPSVGSPSGAIDQVLDDVRELEDQVRRLRADDQIPPEIRREREIELQERMETLMRQALERLGL